MEDLINDSIIESISEEYQIYKMTVDYDSVNDSSIVRYVIRDENEELVAHQKLIDAEPREVFIIACLLIPIIGIGLYPKILTQVYDSTTVQLTARLRDAVPTLAQQKVPAVSMSAPDIDS